MYLVADKKNKTKYRDPSPFDFAQGQDDKFVEHPSGFDLAAV
jgi:hypothetical protein